MKAGRSRSKRVCTAHMVERAGRGVLVTTTPSLTRRRGARARCSAQCARMRSSGLRGGQSTFFDDPVEEDASLLEDGVVGEVPHGLLAALEVHAERPAPESDVGVVGLAGAVH